MRTAESLRLAKRLGLLLALSSILLTTHFLPVTAQINDPCPWCAAARQLCASEKQSIYDSCVNMANSNKQACLTDSATNYSTCITDCGNPAPPTCSTDCQTAKTSRDNICNSDHQWNLSTCSVDFSECDLQEIECRQDCE